MTNKVVEINPPKTGTGARTILTPKESLAHQNCKQVEVLFSQAMSQQKTEIILDCKAVSFIDSAGLELLVETHKKLRTRGGILKIIALNDTCKDILVATRLISDFHVYTDIHEAIRHGV
ncbi:MAG: STAS domain-containing protein [Deltaproteobacteria bacterium]|jgi:anti-sigma B factor antagonist